MLQKVCCTYLPPTPTPPPFQPVPPGGNHPSFTLALQGLSDYERWVSSAVLPIAFAWIEDHKDEVYKKIRYEHRDDVAVVIAAAFELVQKTPAYIRGLQIREAGNDPEKIKVICLNLGDLLVERNPVWTAIETQNSSKVKSDWNRFKDVLDDTIHWESGEIEVESE
jgi:hypothetical protein